VFAVRAIWAAPDLVRDYNFACRSYGIDCGIYDIVKRRSFRDLDQQAIADTNIIISRN
jgi:hypothetical protein